MGVAARVTAVAAGGSVPRALHGASGGDRGSELRRAYVFLLPPSEGLEPHLGGVLRMVGERPGGLVRAQLAYGLLLRHGQGAESAQRLAVALEYFHTASLLFDDLPSMDDAEERRGGACPHRVHGEAACILGALALINRAYALLWSELGDLPADRRRRAASLVEECLGAQGILDGQARDLHSLPGAGEEEALAVAAGKTATLIRLSLVLPARVVGLGSQHVERLERLAKVWGLSYQVLDDLSDCLESPAETGKTTARDQALGRPNLVLAVGPAAAQERLRAWLEEGRLLVARLVPQVGSPVGVFQGQLDFKARRWGLLDTASPTPPVPRSHAVETPLRFADRQFRRAAGSQEMLILTLPAPPVPPEAFLRGAKEEDTCFWDGGDGAVWVGLGAAARLEGRGPGRFLHLRGQAARLFRRHEAVAHGEVPGLRPRCFGGVAFTPGAADHPSWSGFGDGGFVLPRFLYRRCGGEATLSLAVRAEEVAGGSRRSLWLGALELRLARLEEESLLEVPSRVPLRSLLRPRFEDWSRAIGDIRQGISAGRYSKVVAARRSRVLAASELEAWSILHRLRSVAGAKRFAFRRGTTTFLGATPERLVALRGRSLHTEALAGTVESGVGSESALLSDPKIRREHEIVVLEILRRLRPICGPLRVSAQPRPQRHHRVTHLRTCIEAELGAFGHVLDLAAALHPTPAVGGLPSGPALEWIAENETFPRGWYASPVGWFNSRGEGELAVALRCATVTGREAFLYSGAGIVAGSEAASEWQEVALKEETLLGALGLWE